ncbi:hypothetical protein H4R24_003321 [Coemansia sp. RSA 988]|nr:hypothetical protein H4R24_003321 [Coemansia sp. RSA 988]
MSISNMLAHIRLPVWMRTSTVASICTRIVLANIAFAIIVISSTVLYGVYYRLYVPQLMHQAPVYLQYPVLPSENTTADVTFVPDSDYKFLSMSQAYSVRLDLEVPTSGFNRDIGNFMVALDLKNRLGKSMYKSARPSILPYQSLPIRLLNTAVRAVPLVLGLTHESTYLEIPLLDSMYDRHLSPITHAHISMSKPLQVYSAHITICAQFSGLRYWMYYFRISTGVVFIASAVGWQLFLASIAWSALESYISRSRRVTRAPSIPPGEDSAMELSSTSDGQKSQNAQQQLSSLPDSLSVSSPSFFDQPQHQVPSNSGSAMHMNDTERSVPDSVAATESQDSSEEDSVDETDIQPGPTTLLSDTQSRHPSSQSLRRRSSGRSFSIK